MSIIEGMNAATLAMVAQGQRLSVIASNVANANSISSNPESAYKAQLIEFKTIYTGKAQTVAVTNIHTSLAPARPIFDPNNPLSDETGHVYLSNVNREEQLTDLINTQQSYEVNSNIGNTLKNLTINTIKTIKNNN